MRPERPDETWCGQVKRDHRHVKAAAHYEPKPKPSSDVADVWNAGDLQWLPVPAIQVREHAPGDCDLDRQRQNHVWIAEYHGAGTAQVPEDRRGERQRDRNS